MTKHTDKMVLYALRHNTRETPRPPSNEDIDPERTKNNISLAPSDRGGAQPDGGKTALAAYHYYRYRLGEVYHYGRSNLVTAVQWIVTLPDDVAPEQEKIFWTLTYGFLNGLYGEENVIQAIVHTDEGLALNGKIAHGRNHLHYMVIPAVKNEKYLTPNRHGNLTGAAKFGEKICFNAQITRQHLREFHPRFQAFLLEHGLNATVHSGATGGHNRSVAELKNNSIRAELARTLEQLHAVTEELARSREEILALAEERNTLEKRIDEIKYTQSRGVESGWGDLSGWGLTTEKAIERGDYSI